MARLVVAGTENRVAYKRGGRLRVNRVISTLRRSLPIFPNEADIFGVRRDVSKVPISEAVHLGRGYVRRSARFKSCVTATISMPRSMAQRISRLDRYIHQ